MKELSQETKIQQLEEQLEIHRTELEINRLQQSRSLKIQSALYRIAEAASAGLKMSDFYARLHEIISELMVAKNFYIFLYDANKNWRETAFFVDQVGDTPPPPGLLPYHPRSLVRHVLELGETVHLTRDAILRLANNGAIQPMGTMPEDWIGVPLNLEEGTTGILVVQSYDPGACYSEDDVDIISFVAQHIASALSRTRAIEETHQKNAELSIINAVQTALASKLDYNSIVEVIGENISQIFPQEDVSVGYIDADRNMVVVPYLTERGQRSEVEFPLDLDDNSLISLVYATRQPLLINADFISRSQELGEQVINESEVPKSWLSVPIISREKVVGGIVLQNYATENAYAQSDVRLLETLASSMSNALENARLFDETQHLLVEAETRAAELNMINAVSQGLVSEIDLEALIMLAGDKIRSIFNVDIVYIALLDKEIRAIHFPYRVGEQFTTLRYGEGMVSKILESGQPMLINHDVDERRKELGVEYLGRPVLSYLAVPILVGREAIGVISVQDTSREGRFSDNDLHILTTIAANVGSAIRNASLFEEIKKSKEYFEAVISNSPAAIVTMDLDIRVKAWNPAAERLFGYTFEEALGRNLDDLVATSPDIHQEAVQISLESLREQRIRPTITRRTRKDGSLVDVEILGLPVIVGGVTDGFVAIYHDITELQRARQEAVAANQAKSAFLANMSHELRTPLNAIIGFTRIVRRKGEGYLPEKQLENLDKVLISAEHLLGLINSVLDISKIEAGRMEVQPGHFSLQPLVELVTGACQPLLKPDVALKTILSPNLPELYSDQSMLKQIMLNLLSNAAKFTQQGEIVIRARTSGEHLSIEVQDSGIGIPPQALERIFEEFQQADSSTTRLYGGTGLGLTISRQLARLLGGDLTATSQEGTGSTFILSIPAHFGSLPESATASEEIQDEPTLNERPLILVIDDNADVHRMLGEQLADAGYRLGTAVDGEDGIRKARLLQPFAIILDIMLPRKDGWQVLHELKSNPATNQIPVILHTILDNQAKGFRLGAIDYLVKPLDEKALMQTLQRLASWRRLQPPFHLLVVDDDPNVFDLVQQILDSTVYEIQGVEDGLQALAALGQRLPDAVLLDLMMPRMDGFEFLEQLSQESRWKDIPVIVLTSKNLTAADRAVLNERVVAIIHKSRLESERLVREIQAALPDLN